MLSFPHYHNSTHVAHVPVQRISERLVRRDKIRCISTQPWSRRAPSTADPFGFDSSDTVHLEISQIAPPLLCWRICWQLTAVEPTPSLLAPSDEAKKWDQPGGPMDPEPQPKLGPNPPVPLTFLIVVDKWPPFNPAYIRLRSCLYRSSCEII